MDARFRHALIAAATLALVPAVLAAQDVLTGHVTGEGGAPLANATVYIQNTRLGGIAGDDGAYRIVLPAGQVGQTVTVIARLIGYRERSQVVKLTSGTNTVDLALEVAPVQLQGVITVAEGQQVKKSQLGTAAQAVSNENLTQAPNNNFVEQLGAKVSGVEVTSPGTQGGSVAIRIRGSNSITGNNEPLYVIDGVPLPTRDRGSDANGGWDYGSTISDLNADDIQAITVLKGPNAAALYGSEAANGAVIIRSEERRVGKECRARWSGTQ